MITVNGYPYDLVETVTTELKSEITKKPVESGIDVTDNIRMLPRELTFSNAVVSDTPIGAIALDDTRIQGESLPLISQDAYDRLERLWLARKTVVVVTRRRSFPSMGIESISVPEEAKNGGGLIFTIKFNEIRVVTNNQVTVSIPNGSGQANSGLSLAKLTDGKALLWRHGVPPGLGTGTFPPGKIVSQEVVIRSETKPGKSGAFTHQNTGKVLTAAEIDALNLDLARDLAEQGGIQGKTLTDKSQALDDKFAKAQKMEDWSDAHPGRTVNKSMFGL